MDFSSSSSVEASEYSSGEEEQIEEPIELEDLSDKTFVRIEDIVETLEPYIKPDPNSKCITKYFHSRAEIIGIMESFVTYAANAEKEDIQFLISADQKKKSGDKNWRYVLDSSKSIFYNQNKIRLSDTKSTWIANRAVKYSNWFRSSSARYKVFQCAISFWIYRLFDAKNDPLPEDGPLFELAKQFQEQKYADTSDENLCLALNFTELQIDPKMFSKSKNANLVDNTYNTSELEIIEEKHIDESDIKFQNQLAELNNVDRLHQQSVNKRIAKQKACSTLAKAFDNARLEKDKAEQEEEALRCRRNELKEILKFVDFNEPIQLESQEQNHTSLNLITPPYSDEQEASDNQI